MPPSVRQHAHHVRAVRDLAVRDLVVLREIGRRAWDVLTGLCFYSACLLLASSIWEWFATQERSAYTQLVARDQRGTRRLVSAIATATFVTSYSAFYVELAAVVRLRRRLLCAKLTTAQAEETTAALRTAIALAVGWAWEEVASTAICGGYIPIDSSALWLVSIAVAALGFPLAVCLDNRAQAHTARAAALLRGLAVADLDLVAEDESRLAIEDRSETKPSPQEEGSQQPSGERQPPSTAGLGEERRTEPAAERSREQKSHESVQLVNSMISSSL